MVKEKKKIEKIVRARLVIYVPETLKEKFRIFCEKTGVSMTDMAEAILSHAMKTN